MYMDPFPKTPLPSRLPHYIEQSSLFSASLLEEKKLKVAQSCLTVCDPADYTAHGILQARILEWVIFPFSRGSSQTQGSNLGLLHCRRILYRLSHQ